MMLSVEASAALAPHTSGVSSIDRTLHRNDPHSMTSVPCARRSRDRDREALDRRVERLRLHRRRPEVARTIVFRAPLAGLRVDDEVHAVRRCGAVQSVYFPAGRCSPPSVIGADVVNCVAAFAPVRQTSSYGMTSPSSFRPRASGRP